MFSAPVSVSGADLVAECLVVRYNPPYFMNLAGPHLILSVAGGLAVCVALYLCWLRISGASTRRKGILLALRAILLLLVLAAVLNPVLRRETVVERPPVLLVAVDVSPSMTHLPLDGPSRWDVATQTLSDGPLAAALEQANVEPLLALAGDDLRSVRDLPDDPEPLSGTDLQAALSEALRTPRHRIPAACLLISDGADATHRPPRRVAEGLGAYRTPVFCRGVGDPEPGPDVTNSGVVAPETVTEGEQFELRALIHAPGLTGSEIEVSLREGQRKLREATLEPGEVDRPLSFSPPAGAPAAHPSSRGPRPAALEAPPPNNHRSLVVRVEPAEARLLWIEGSPRREYAFLRRLLVRVEDLDVTILLRKRDPDQFWRDDEEPRPASLSSAGSLSRFRGVVLSNIDAPALGGLTSRLADYVTGGGALAMLGGPDSFGAGGWADTPLAGMLPVRISSGEGLLADPISVRLSGNSELSRALRETGIERWDRLPLLEGLNAVSGAAPDAEVALEAVTGGDVPAPAFAARRHGAGRTLAVTVDDTWRWRQSPSAGAHSKAAWEALWTTVIGRLLAPRAERQVVLEIGRDRVEADMPIRADVHVTDEQMRPVNGASVRVEVEGPGADRAVVADPSRTEGVYRATVRPAAPGSYRLRAVAERGGEELGEDTRTVEVIEPIGEVTDAARPEVLEAIAAETGGSYRPIERADEMAELLPLEPERRQRQVRLHPARMWWFFAMILIVAAADWLLRRRWGVG